MIQSEVKKVKRFTSDDVDYSNCYQKCITNLEIWEHKSRIYQTEKEQYAIINIQKH